MKLKQHKEPKIGDVRTVNGFALLPTVIDENSTVWLERYEKSEIYVKPMNLPGAIVHPFWATFDTTTDRCLMPLLYGGKALLYGGKAFWREAHPKEPGPPPAMWQSGVRL